MALLEWLFGPHRNLKCAPDRIWYSRAEMRAGFAEIVRPDLNALTIIVTHFPSLLAEIRESLQGRIEFTEISHPSELVMSSRQPSQHPPVALATSSILAGIGCPTLPTGLNRVQIVVYMRHLLSEKDEAIENFGEKFACPGEIGFNVSLDDPLLQLFAKDWVKEFLRNNANGSHWLESAMVAKSLKKAQARILARAVSRYDTDSPEEWLKKNIAETT